MLLRTREALSDRLALTSLWELARHWRDASAQQPPRTYVTYEVRPAG